MKREAQIKVAVAVAVLVGIAVACGGGGGGGSGDASNGGGGGSSSVIQGNVSSAATTAVERERRGWLARLGTELGGFVRQAFAATGLGGVQVRATGVRTSGVTDITDDTGGFALGGSPTGNVTVVFSRDRCQGEIILPDISNDSVLTLEDVAFDCTGARPANVSETFRGVIRSVPSTRDGSLTVCAFSAETADTRVVKLGDTVVKDTNGTPTSFNALAAGQLIEASGDREGLGSSSALDADTVKILGGGNPDVCSGGNTPTPGPTETPSSEATPAATPSPTP